MKREINSMFDEGRIGAIVSEKLLGKRFALRMRLFNPENISLDNMVEVGYVQSIDGRDSARVSPNNKVVFGHVQSIDGRKLESQKKEE